MNVLDLFSGIGGFSLGLERAGMRTVAFCEIEPYARRVLAKHWPDVPCYTDVRELTADRLRADGLSVDVICGGFPCQDISFAGAGAGLAGERSGLWFEYARIIGEVRPQFVIVENVAALLSRGLDVVLGDLATLGYDAEWHCIPASALGAPHRRDRVWIVAHASEIGARPPDWCRSGRAAEDDARGTVSGSRSQNSVADAAGQRRRETGQLRPDKPSEWPASSSQDVSDTIRSRQSRPGQPVDAIHPTPRLARQAIDAFNGGVGNIWRAEPDVGRVANGVPFRLDRLRGLGNAVVPQIPEIIGRAIMKIANPSG